MGRVIWFVWGLLAAGVMLVGYLDANCRVLPGIRAVICGF